MPALRISYRSPRLLRTVLFQLQQQQQAGLFCDVTLQGDGEGIHAHSCVIAACSPYLANLLMVSTAASEVSDPKTPILSNRRVLRFHGIKRLHLFALVHYMYTSELEIAPGDVSGVLKAAKKLQIPELELLKLEGGRLVRSESGTRLNRNCLGRKTPNLNANTDKEAKDENKEIIHSCTHIEIKPTRNRRNKIQNDVNRLSDFEQSNENTLNIEVSSCGPSKVGSTNLSCLENILSSDGSLEDLVNSHGYLKNMPSSPNLLQPIHGNQNSGAYVPVSHNSGDVANSYDLIENDLLSQNFMTDVNNNQNSPTDAARSLDLMEYRLKDTLDYVPNNQVLLQQTVNVCDLLDNVQFSQDLLDNMQSPGGWPVDVHSPGGRLVDVHSPGGRPVDVRSPGGRPVDVQCPGARPVDVQSPGARPVDVQSAGARPEDVQSAGARPEDVQSAGARPEDVQSAGARPEDVQSAGARPEDVQSAGARPEDVQSAGARPEDVQSAVLLSEGNPKILNKQKNLLKRCETAFDNQEKSSPEVMSNPERECLVECQHLRYPTKSTKELLKRIRVDPKSEEIASVDTEFLKLMNSDMNCKYNTSVSDEFEKHNILSMRNSCLTEDGLDDHWLSEQCDKSCFPNWHNNEQHTVDLKLHEESESREDAAHLEGLECCELRKGENMLHKDECVTEKVIDSRDSNDPPASDTKINNCVPHAHLENLKQASSALMTEMQNVTAVHMGFKSSIHHETKTRETVDQDLEELTSSTNEGYRPSVSVDQEGLTSSTNGVYKSSVAVDQEDLTSSIHCEPEMGEVDAYNMSRNEPKKRPYDWDDSFENEVQKLKLRRTNDGLNWEVVSKVESLNIACHSKGKELLKELEEQVEQIDIVTSSMSPDVDVGMYSPPMFLEECVWPDLSSDSDMELDVLV